MARLTLPEGQPITFKVKSANIAEYRYHWLENTAISCSGEGCEACRAGKSARSRYRVKVERDGEEYDLEMGKRLRDELIAKAGGEAYIMGRTFTVIRRGSGVNTQYEVSVGAGVLPPSSEVTTPPGEIVKYLDEILKDERARAIMSAFLYLVASFLEAVSKVEAKSGKD